MMDAQCDETEQIYVLILAAKALTKNGVQEVSCDENICFKGMGLSGRKVCFQGQICLC